MRYYEEIGHQRHIHKAPETTTSPPKWNGR